MRRSSVRLRQAAPSDPSLGAGRTAAEDPRHGEASLGEPAVFERLRSSTNATARLPKPGVMATAITSAPTTASELGTYEVSILGASPR